MDRITESAPKAAVATTANAPPKAVAVKSGGGKKSLKDFFKKLKGVKNIELIVAGIVCVIVLAVYFSASLFPKKETEQTAAATFSEYAAAVEQKLAKILSEIKGAGKVSVMITYESGVELVYAYSTDTQTNSSSDGAKETSVTYEKNTIVVSGGQPVVVKEIMPLIKGVVVVAEGATNVNVKLDIIKAVTALLEIAPSRIEIFAKAKT